MILAIETGGELASVALLEETAVAAEQAFRHRMSLSRELMPAIDALLAQTGVKWSDVEAVAVGLGPGSYTGLRIGVVTAKALAWGSGRPVLGIASLAALVAPCAAPPEALLCAVLEARADEFFAALYQRRDDELQVRAEATVLRADVLAQRLSAYPGPVVMAGHTARFAGALRQTPDARRPTPGGEATIEDKDTAGEDSASGSGAPNLGPNVWRLALDVDQEPQARWVGRLAVRRLRVGERDDPIGLAPLYARAPAPTLRPAA